MDKEYVVISAMKSGEFSTQYGKMIKYLTQFEGEQDACEWSMKEGSPAPTAGQKVMGSIADTQYGRKFTKAKGQGFGGGRAEDPQKQENISRQNALTNAVTYVLGKAQFMDVKKAEKYVSGKQVIETAKYFLDFTQGKLNFDGVAAEQPSATAPVAPTQTTVSPSSDDSDPGYDPSEYEGI